MIWIPKHIPRNGDTEIVRRFAFFPMQLTNGHKVWLQFYFQTYEYVHFDNVRFLGTATTLRKLR